MNNERIVDQLERERSRAETRFVDFYSQAVEVSARFREEYEGRVNVVKAATMPMERSPDGLIKHIINEKMDTKECCIDVYQQFIPPGRKSGKHRHLSEEIFYVIEGSGYDLHWDVKYDCKDAFEFEWATEPQKFEWSQGDFVYIPPYCAHQHFNIGAGEARIVVINSRIIKPMGFDWFDQLESVEE